MIGIPVPGFTMTEEGGGLRFKRVGEDPLINFDKLPARPTGEAESFLKAPPSPLLRLPQETS